VTADDFFLEIESHFAERRGTAFVFSAKDWALLKSWRDEGIPLPVIIEAIDRCFDKRAESGRKGPISSLRYCRHAVKEIWEERKDLTVGSHGELPESDPQRLLEQLQAAVQSAAADRGGAIAESLRAAAASIAELKGSVPQIDQRLMQVEDELIHQVLDLLPADERQAMEKELDSLLAGYAAQDPETLRKTRDANLRRLVRLRLGLPRLSLFG
jgi:hypothetical protein